MKTLLVHRNIDLLPRPNEYHLILDHREPPAELTSSAFILAFEDDHLLMTRLRSRGWDIPLPVSAQLPALLFGNRGFSGTVHVESGGAGTTAVFSGRSTSLAGGAE